MTVSLELLIAGINAASVDATSAIPADKAINPGSIKSGTTGSPSGPKATSGDVFINGKNTQSMKKDELSNLRNEAIGFIFQFHYLLPEFTALENVLMPYRISKKPITEEVMSRALELLDIVGLTKVKDNLAINMSGGQQQRVAIARALINNPKIILADEPTGNLDSDTTEQVYELLREINLRFKTTFIIITHDRHIAEKADRIIEIKDGRINLDIQK